MTFACLSIEGQYSVHFGVALIGAHEYLPGRPNDEVADRFTGKYNFPFFVEGCCHQGSHAAAFPSL